MMLNSYIAISCISEQFFVTLTCTNVMWLLMLWCTQVQNRATRSNASRSDRVHDISELTSSFDICKFSYDSFLSWQSIEFVEHWTSKPKIRGFDSHRGQANFSACPVWIYTQSNITITTCGDEFRHCLNLKALPRLLLAEAMWRTDSTATSSFSWCCLLNCLTAEL